MWLKMADRCYRPKEVSFERYGGVGITVCQEWLLPNGVGYLNFKNHLLRLYPNLLELLEEGYELDRIKSTLNYEPGNVQMSPRNINQRHKKNTLMVEIVDSGEVLALIDYYERLNLNVSYEQVIDRVRGKGYPLNVALETPLGKPRVEDSGKLRWINPPKKNPYRYYEFKGEKLSISEIARRLNVNNTLVKKLIDSGVNLDTFKSNYQESLYINRYGKTREEIAKQLGITVSTLSSKVARGFDVLAQLKEKENDA